DFVADLDALLDGLGITEPVHLVGNSFGGTIAFSFAAAHPDRVHSIVSSEAEPATGAWADRMGRTLANVVDEMEKEENQLWLAETYGAHHARLAKSASAIIRATSIVQDVPRGPLLEFAQLQEISCPVLSIVGSDGFHRDDLRALQGTLPRCRTEVIDGQNHSVLVERHRMVRRLVLDWVTEHHVQRDEAGAA